MVDSRNRCHVKKAFAGVAGMLIASPAGPDPLLSMSPLEPGNGADIHSGRAP